MNLTSAGTATKTRLLFGIAAIGALAALVMLPGPALAKRIAGTNRADKIVGTARHDRINARGGSDRVRGRSGGDRLAGSRGRDRLSGGNGADKLAGSKGKDRLNGAKGKDRLAGGRGADRLNAVDKRRDRKVDGGPGRDVCTIDQADLPLLESCERVKVKNGGGGGGGGDGLEVTSASGLSCAQSLPLCNFQISGEGAESTIGTVSGGGGASTALGAGVSVSGDGSWQALGLYGCTDDGYLEVTIGSKSARVPITCTA
jgi:hypothetical protein